MRLPQEEANEIKHRLRMAGENFPQVPWVDLQISPIALTDALALCKDHDELTKENFDLHLQLTDYSRRALEVAQMARQLLPDPKAVQTAIERADQMIELVDPRWALMRRSEQETE